MGWADLARFALRNLRRRGARSLLTVLAVGLGTSLLVALLAISGTADSRVVSQLGKGGPIAAIHVDDSRPAANALSSDDFQTAGHADLTNAAVASIRQSAHVTAVVPVLALPAVAVPCPPSEQAAEGTHLTAACILKPQRYFTDLVGADLRQADQLPVAILAGRLPSPGSMVEVAVTQSYLNQLQINPGKAAAVLGTDVELGTPRVVGDPQHFQMRWFLARIVGVVAQSVESGDFLVPIEQTQAAREFVLSGTARPDFMGGISSQYSALVVIADSLGTVHAVREEITNLGFSTSAPEHLVASVQKYLHVVDIVLGAIGLVALLIAALGIANSLLAAVRERWREIGVMKAIGAEDGDVLRWFLVEAGAVGAAGGLLGTAAGLAIAWSVGVVVNGYLLSQGLQGIDLGQLPVQLAVIAPLGTVALALVAGALPSLRAARLPAREALGGL